MKILTTKIFRPRVMASQVPGDPRARTPPAPGTHLLPPSQQRLVLMSFASSITRGRCVPRGPAGRHQRAQWVGTQRYRWDTVCRLPAPAQRHLGSGSEPVPGTSLRGVWRGVTPAGVRVHVHDAGHLVVQVGEDNRALKHDVGGGPCSTGGRSPHMRDATQGWGLVHTRPSQTASSRSRGPSLCPRTQVFRASSSH